MADIPDSLPSEFDTGGAAPTSGGPALAAVPRPLSSFVGREREVEAVLGFLRAGARLLTLVGPGGVGKSRLAIQVADELSADFADGVRFVDLAPIREPALVGATIAQALGLQEDPAQSIEEGLRQHLHRADLLLVLDNFEQVIEAASFVSGLVGACPALRVLTTSRAPLRVSGEQQLPVSPLALPDPKAETSRSLLADNPAVRLLVERARASRPGFALTDENAEAVAEICRRLDGMPLAIELAAPRFSILSPQALLARLDRRLAILAGNTRDAPQRHRTLEAAVAWSYDLLPNEQQAAFRRLAVFAGGFTIEAAEAVAALGPAAPDLLGSLVEQSLVLPAAEQEEVPRLRMLETVREFAAAKLVETGEDDAIKAAHADYFLALAEQGDVELSGREQAAWAVRLDLEHDNFRAALAWCLSHAERVETALRLSGALWRFWDRLGYVREGRDWLERTLAASGDNHSPARAKVLFSLGNTLYQNPARARELYAESLAIYRRLNDPAGVSRALRGLGMNSIELGDYPRARHLYEESLGLAQGVGDEAGIALTLHHLGIMATMEGDYTRARELCDRACQIWQDHGDDGGAAHALRWLAKVARLENRLDDADGLLDRSLNLFRSVHNEDDAPYVLLEVGLTALARGTLTDAMENLRLALAAHNELGNQHGVVEALEAIAQVALSAKSEEIAGTLLGAADSWRKQARLPLPPAELAYLHRRLQDVYMNRKRSTFDAAWVLGSQLSLVDAVAESDKLMPPHPAVPVWPAAKPSKSTGHAWAESQGLTPREIELLPLIASGKTDQQIAKDLFISRRTVTTHVSSVLAKLGVSSRTAVAALATRHGVA